VKWSRFYTPASVAKNIVELIPPGFSPEGAIDICVGSGNFLNAAYSKWGKIKLVGADLNLSVSNIKLDAEQINLFKIDALNISNLSGIPSLFSGNKVILANPPFGKAKGISIGNSLSSNHSILLDEAKKVKRIEALMLVSNMELMNKGDYFGALLPENFFSADSFETFRGLFCSCFENIQVGHSEKFFSKSDVRTRIFVGRYKGICRKVKFMKTAKIVSSFKLFRGIDNSRLEDNSGNSLNEIVHFSNREGNILKKKYADIGICRSDLLITKESLLVLRVGRNSGLVFKPKTSFLGKYPSDYFYLVKGVDIQSNNVGLFEKALLNKVKGLTTKYLTKGDIEETLKKMFF